MIEDHHKIFKLYRDSIVSKLHLESVNETGDDESQKVVEDGKEYWVDSEKRLHRADGPAYEDYRRKSWFWHGDLHRIGGPASIDKYLGVEYWLRHGKYHREDGPAVEYIHGNGTDLWYANDKRYSTPEKWAAAILSIQGKPSTPQNIQDFLRPILKKDIEQAL